MDRTVSLVVAGGVDQRVVESLWQLYAYDLSEFRRTMPDAMGRFKSSWLDEAWTDDSAAVCLTRLSGVPAGFALVAGLGEGQPKRVRAFFVARGARASGLGWWLATELTNRFPGRWSIAFQEENPTAARFWRRWSNSGFNEVTEERRPVPGKPDLPPDVWLSFDTDDQGT
ncbi:GNAT family N-acetyltransferase [Solicola sp. PLA-1-18]|uniref:GNAT family N-acetyltransferase n=1 Tax=Solicola sp. PLA-1-18 TaxID=3380532 RepID=UPI003B82A8DC